MSIFETVMIVCFGLSWPVSIAKALRTKTVAGKSPAFMAIVFVGYGSGVVHKLLYSRDWLVVLYVLNAMLVLADFCLYLHYAKRKVCV